jgi:hypothetical protein
MSVPDDVDLDELAKWMNMTGLSLEQLLGREELIIVKETEVVNEWRSERIKMPKRGGELGFSKN